MNASLVGERTRQDIEELARQLRVDSILATTAAGSGHPTSALSAADLTAVLLARHFRFDSDQPDRLSNDRFILSKGHAAPLLYAAQVAFGLVERGHLATLRSDGSPLEGHPVPTLPMVDVATGSLGQGLSIGLGLAIGQGLLSVEARTWVLLGDSEMAEGSVWEAMELAGQRRVDKLTAVVDVNGLGQVGRTMHGHDTSAFATRAEMLGWRSIEIDGHDLDSIDEALHAATRKDLPTLIAARTLKGKGVSFAQDQTGWHGRAFSEDEATRAVDELGGGSERTWSFSAAPHDEPHRTEESEPPTPAETSEEEVSTRDAFGAALVVRMRSNPRLVVLDAEVGDSTRTEAVREDAPGRFIQSFIAEQNMVGMATGLQVLGFHPVAATFGAFLTRAHDIIRMADIGRARMTLVGSHAGVSIGEDGPSQMALDDIAMMRALRAMVLYPADGMSCRALLDVALDHDGISYLRTTRGTTPVLYSNSTTFEPGGCHVHNRSDGDRVTLVGAGVTVFEALAASRRLEGEGIGARVVDLYSVAPIDARTLRDCASETEAMVVVEDHRPQGGIGEAVLAALSGAPRSGPVACLSVVGTPGSAEPAQQRRQAGIDAEAIVQTVHDLLG